MMPLSEIHPMVVHFPIVFWIMGEIAAIAILMQKGNLSARHEQWSMAAFCLLIGGTISAFLAVFFGNIALDYAAVAGFMTSPIKAHKYYATFTLSLFFLHSILRFLAIRYHYSLIGIRGWLAEIPGIAGILFLFITVYLGGRLVYHFGINVDVAAP